MNRILLEVVRSNFYIHEGALNGFTPLLLKFLAGESIDMKLSPMEISSYSYKTQNVVAHRSDAPIDVVNAINEDTILLVNIDDVITKYDSCGWYGAQSYAKLINSAAINPFVKGIVIIGDSPGGSSDGSFDLAHAVKKASAIKPVVTFVDGMAASAMYRIAAHSNHIVAKPGSIVGSIGTMVKLFDYTEQMKKFGVVERNIYADKSPDKNKSIEDAIKGEAELFKVEVLNPMNDIFLQEMKAERNLSDAVMTGKVYLPEAALAEGMIDSIGVLDDAIEVCKNLINQTKTNNNMALKIPNVIASFLGLSAQTESISQEQVDLLSAKLESMNETETKVSALTDQVSQLTDSKTSLEATLQEKETAIESLNATIQTLSEEAVVLNEQIVTLGAQPAAEGTNPPAVDGNIVALDLSQLDETARAIVEKFL